MASSDYNASNSVVVHPGDLQRGLTWSQLLNLDTPPEQMSPTIAQVPGIDPNNLAQISALQDANGIRLDRPGDSIAETMAGRPLIVPLQDPHQNVTVFRPADLVAGAARPGSAAEQSFQRAADIAEQAGRRGAKDYAAASQNNTELWDVARAGGILPAASELVIAPLEAPEERLNILPRTDPAIQPAIAENMPEAQGLGGRVMALAQDGLNALNPVSAAEAATPQEDLAANATGAPAPDAEPSAAIRSHLVRQQAERQLEAAEAARAAAAANPGDAELASAAEAASAEASGAERIIAALDNGASASAAIAAAEAPAAAEAEAPAAEVPEVTPGAPTPPAAEAATPEAEAAAAAEAEAPAAEAPEVTPGAPTPPAAEAATPEAEAAAAPSTPVGSNAELIAQLEALQEQLRTGDSKYVGPGAKGTTDEASTLALQSAIKALNPDTDLGTYGANQDGLDGDFGTKTYEGLQEYQKSKGLANDGQAGEQTIQSMIDDLKAREQALGAPAPEAAPEAAAPEAEAEAAAPAITPEATTPPAPEAATPETTTPPSPEAAAEATPPRPRPATPEAEAAAPAVTPEATTPPAPEAAAPETATPPAPAATPEAATPPRPRPEAQEAAPAAAPEAADHGIPENETPEQMQQRMLDAVRSLHQENFERWQAQQGGGSRSPATQEPIQPDPSADRASLTPARQLALDAVRDQTTPVSGGSDVGTTTPPENVQAALPKVARAEVAGVVAV